MSSLYILIPLGLIQIVVAVALLLWAIRRDQFEDFDGPAEQILMDLDLDSPPPVHEQKTEQPNRS